MKAIFTILVTFFALATSCGGDLTVHASTPDCIPERFFGDGGGNPQPPIENADYLQFASQACVITANVNESYTLKFNHTVQAADMQMGSNTGSNLRYRKIKPAFWLPGGWNASATKYKWGVGSV